MANCLQVIALSAGAASDFKTASNSCSFSGDVAGPSASAMFETVNEVSNNATMGKDDRRILMSLFSCEMKLVGKFRLQVPIPNLKPKISNGSG
jgi:hypothetical protein